ncbi:MAG: hypothetical protein PF440_01915 [Thiomicrorhabdus sp.]|jgi:hypothetical protein|nr:hypothetical protein [Thiomicrorhabdus sp.]
MIIAIPSKGRAGLVKTQKLISSCVVFVPELEKQAYIEAGTNNVIGVPNEVHGITATRNWILKNTDDQHVVMIDDDVKQQGYFKLFDRKGRQKKLNEMEWLEEFAKLFQVTEDLNYRIWGVATDGALRSVYPYKPFSFRSYITASCMGIINDGRTYFNEDFKVKEDYELNLRCIKEDGGVVCARHLFWANSHWHDDGGCKEYRTQEMERDAIRMLKELYPGMIRTAKRANSEWTISIL